MRTYRLFTAILAIIVIACLSGVQGQYSTPSSIVTPNATPQYTQYYTMPTVSAPSSHISAPAKTAIVGKTPTTLYLGTQQQSVPYSQYQANPNNAVVPSLWIQGVGSWTQYVVIPQGATATLLAVSPTGGSGYLDETRPDGTTYNSNFYFYPYSELVFNADTIGRHVLSFGINGQTSNTVIIDVAGNNAQPTVYPPSPMSYYPSDYYSSSYYPSDYYDNASPFYHRSGWW